jgi:hypothetical protein
MARIDTVTARPVTTITVIGIVRAENLMRGYDLQGCSPGRLAVMITDHVPAVRHPPDHARVLVAAVVTA